MTDAPKVYLFFLTGAKKGKIEASDARIVRIGRQPYCEVQLDAYQDIPASGEHAASQERVHVQLEEQVAEGASRHRPEARPSTKGLVGIVGRHSADVRTRNRIKRHREHSQNAFLESIHGDTMG